MIKLLKATLTIEAPDNLSNAELEKFSEAIEEMGLLDKLYGATRELLRERIEDGSKLAVFLED